MTIIKTIMISVALALHNEEKNIARCLQSVYDWVDEIIIVDGESTDDTIAVVKEYDLKNKTKIFHEKNEIMFHKNKQKALEQCSGKWILQLDADEVVSPELKNEIRAVIANSNQSHQPLAYSLPRLNHFLGRPLKKGGQYPDYTIRLYMNGSTRFPCKTIHEQVMLLDPKAKIGTLNQPILHYPYPNFDMYIRKWIQYSAFEADQLVKNVFEMSWVNGLNYFFILPTKWFFNTYIRHKGFQDGFAGFVFSLFSSIRFWIIYVFVVEQKSAHPKYMAPE